MKEQSFINWARQHAYDEAYQFYYISVPPWPSGLQEIEIRIWWPSAVSPEAKIRIRLTGFFDDWLKQGQLEKVKYQTLSPSFCDDWRVLILQSDFWKPSLDKEIELNWSQGEQTEMEGWKMNPKQSSHYRKYFFQPLKPSDPLYPLQLRLFQWVELSKLSTLKFPTD